MLGEQINDQSRVATSITAATSWFLDQVPRLRWVKMRLKSNFLHQFAVLSFLSIVVITLVSSAVISRFVTDKILLRDATLSNEFIQNIVVEEGTWSHFTQKLSDEPNSQLIAFTRQLQKLPDVVRINLFRTDGFYLWSTNRNLIGERYTGNEELRDALDGSVAYETGYFGKTSKEEHAQMREGLRFVESYLPIWNRDRTKVVGAVELYKVPHALNQVIAEGRWLVWTSSIIGGVLLFASLFLIVHRASLRMDLQQKQLVESEALAMIGETAAAVAHSMRNPLASIRACAELTLSDDLEGARESAQDIIHETDRLSHWARDLLHFSNLETGHMEMVDINETVRTSVKGHGESLHQKKIRVLSDMTDSLPYVRANEAPIDQMLTSLITNALEAVGEDGVVTVKTGYDPVEQQVVIDVTDNGPGISPDMIGKIFRPFFTTKQSGTGLGLPLSRRFVEAFGGTLDLTSQMGLGTTVTVRLPATA